MGRSDVRRRGHPHATLRWKPGSRHPCPSGTTHTTRSILASIRAPTQVCHRSHAEQRGEHTGRFPSSPEQFDLARQLVDGLGGLGVTDVTLGDDCCVYAKVPATPGREGKPKRGVVAHVDMVRHIEKCMRERWGAGMVTLTIRDEHKNMESVIRDCPYAIDYAKEAACRAVIELGGLRHPRRHRWLPAVRPWAALPQRGRRRPWLPRAPRAHNGGGHGPGHQHVRGAREDPCQALGRGRTRRVRCGAES